MNRSILELFLDESGKFEDAPPGAGRAKEPSQLVGVLAPDRLLNREVAEEILFKALAAGGMALVEEVHAAETPKGAAYDEMVLALVDELSRRGIQPVRIVNRERVVYGDRTANYTNVLAELAVRIFREQSKGADRAIGLRVVAARVVLGRDEHGYEEYIAGHDYQRRLREYAAFAAVRHGMAYRSANWAIDDFRLESGRRRRDLQICDILSNASYRDFGKCGPEAQRRLRQAFGAYDQSLAIVETFSRVEEFLDRGEAGQAIRCLVEEGVSAPDAEIQARVREALRRSVAMLAEMGAPARDLQLQPLPTLLGTLVDVQRSLDLGRRAARYVLVHVCEPLAQSLPEDERVTLDWFAFVVRRWALTASNHLGILSDSRKEAEALSHLTPKLAGRWEFAPLIMEVLLARAVHLNDCYEVDEAQRLAKLVADYYLSLGQLFPDALPDVFAETVRSDVRGKALGTLLQVQIKLGAREAATLDVARETSDEAIREFGNAADRQRQWQYRCQLETLAGELEEARRYLGMSLGLARGATHEEVAAAIRGLRHAPGAQGFALLHFLRLGAAHVSPGRGATEGAEFLDAFDDGLRSLPWCVGDATTYPAHGILRRLAFIDAATGRLDSAVSAVNRLSTLKPTSVLGLVELAARCEVAALALEQDPRVTDRLVDSAKGNPRSLRLLAERIEQESAPFPQLASTARSLLTAANSVRRSPDRLLEAARTVVE